MAGIGKRQGREEPLANPHHRPPKSGTGQEYAMPEMSQEEARKALFNPNAPERPKLPKPDLG